MHRFDMAKTVGARTWSCWGANHRQYIKGYSVMRFSSLSCWCNMFYQHSIVRMIPEIQPSQLGICHRLVPVLRKLMGSVVLLPPINYCMYIYIINIYIETIYQNIYKTNQGFSCFHQLSYALGDPTLHCWRVEPMLPEAAALKVENQLLNRQQASHPPLLRCGHISSSWWGMLGYTPI